jgi:hypothetical protein
MAVFPYSEWLDETKATETTYSECGSMGVAAKPHKCAPRPPCFTQKWFTRKTGSRRTDTSSPHHCVLAKVERVVSRARVYGDTRTALVVPWRVLTARECGAGGTCCCSGA